MSEKHLGYATEEMIKQELFPVDDTCCLNCKFFDKHEHATADLKYGRVLITLTGWCKRFPPSHDPEDNECRQPSTIYHWWCGEFVKADDDRGMDYVCYEPS
jgi:hypothetical protein